MTVNIFRWRRAWRAARIRKQVRIANRARDRQAWQTAADVYAGALAMDPALTAIHVQHGNMLKEAGDGAGAVRAYERALALDSEDPDAWLQLGHALKQLARPADAVDAYHRAVTIDPALRAAARELLALGSADRVPPLLRESRDRISDQVGRLIDQTAALRHDLAPYTDATRSYTAFRQLHPIAPPPDDDSGEPPCISVLIDGRDRRAAEIATTLASLREQVGAGWTARCIIDPALAEHPVVSASYLDSRIRFCLNAPVKPHGALTVFLSAGTILDPQALAWYNFVSARTGCTACYADHDHAAETWRGLRGRHDPVLQPWFDPDWFGSGLSMPAVICVASSALGWPLDLSPTRSERLCALARGGASIVHVPRILGTVVDVVADVRNAPPGPEDAHPATIRSCAIAERGAAGAGTTVAIVIPTRDVADMLATCVATLFDTAADRGRLEVIVVDNRSRETRTIDILADLERRYPLRVIPFDEPFNWSRANNAAARDCAAEVLLFLNNDTEMQTRGWDDLLAADLARVDIGVVGARLLYPDTTIQHAGIVLGMGDGAPRHEGVGSTLAEGGPEGRWLRRRSVGALTGAAMAMRRSTWRDVGGFDEALAVGYNDVDMCLRVRERGCRVLYVPELCLIHHESKTRGMNVNRSQIAWDRTELRALYRRWGEALLRDPAVNLQWSRQGAAFEAFEEPTTVAIIADLDRQVRRTEAVGAVAPSCP